MPTANEWDIANALVAFERDASSNIVALHHPGYPYLSELGSGAISDLVEATAQAYLGSVGAPLRLSEQMLPLKRRSEGSIHVAASALGLTWLPLDDSDPRNSVNFARKDFPHDAARVLDRSVAMFAVLATDRGGVPMGSRLGLRIHAWVRAAAGAGGRWSVGITGVMVSAELRSQLNPALPVATALASNFANLQALSTQVTALKTQAALDQGVEESRVHVNGLRLVAWNPLVVEAYHSLAADPLQAASLPEAQTVQGTFSMIGGLFTVRLHSIESHPLVAHATARPRLFAHAAGAGFPADTLIDPMSQSDPALIEDARSNRSPKALEPFRERVQISLPVGVGPLVDPNGWFVVRQSRLAGADETQPMQLDPTLLPTARTNDFAAVSAFHQTTKLFDAIHNSGLASADFFRFAAQPLIVRYRATIRPGPGKDGKTVNAQVEFEAPACDFNQPWSTQVLGQIQVRFALADLLRSSSSREPLGLAADPRWSWHEFCHFMLAGATGKLELSFVHSLGDALAAVACDPQSALVDDGRLPGLRGATFPWVYINRRHDRSARLGWSWSGSYHRPGRFSQANSNCRHKGYDSEQILSTTLFHLYRCLGGDTVKGDGSPDLAVRQGASDYVVYLIMRVILTLGAASAVPLETAEQLAACLSDADVATQPATLGPLAGRVGGCAYKAIRWSFEVQGMYSGVAQDVIHNGPGKPPDTDLYLDDGRPDADAQEPRGGYMPVSLDWSSDRPAWHATGDDATQRGAIVVSAARKVRATLRNRGHVQASGVRLRLWWIDWPTGTPAPDWNQGNWQSRVATGPGTLAAQGSAAYERRLPFVSGRRYLILAQADCDQDASNINPITALPCVTNRVRLSELVPGDNNLGLRSYTHP